MSSLQDTAFEAAIVDLDGTMVDTVGDFEVALRLALADLGWPPVSRDFISRTVGKGSEYLLKRTLEQVGAPPDSVRSGLGALPAPLHQHQRRALGGRTRAWWRACRPCARAACAWPA